MAKRRRKMSAKQLKYFGKKRTRTVYVKTRTKRRKRSIMSKRRSYSRSRGISGMKGMLAPIVSGVADSYIDNISPIDGLGSVIIGGFLMRNETMKNIGLYKVGFSLGNILPLPGRGSTVGNGGML